MKKLLIALALVIGLLAVLATTALADNGPHGGAAFSNGSTDACAGCHRIHSAKSADGFLLVATDVYALCTSCHDGTGAYTNVVDGYYTKNLWNAVDHGTAPTYTQGTQDLGLFAGGFVNARMLHTYNGRNAYTVAALPVAAPVNDAHEVGQGLFTALGTTWGAGDVVTATVNTGRVLTAELECTSCHDPHGNAGRTGGVSTGGPVPSYRLLRFSPDGSLGFETTGPSAAYFVNAGTAGITQAGAAGGVFVADVATKWYTPNTVAAADPGVQAWRTRWDGTRYTPWSVITVGAGDYVGRSYMYQLPAIQGATAGGYVSTGTGGVTGMFSCATGTGLPPALPTAQLLTATAGTDYITCGAATGTVFNNNTPRGKIGLWCSTCHDRYAANSSSTATAFPSRTTASGDAYYMYRHNTVGSVVCVDCHTAHGSSSAVYPANGTNYSATATVNTAHPSDLLKLDNRGICVRCHGTSVNFQFTP